MSTIRNLKANGNTAQKGETVGVQTILYRLKELVSDMSILEIITCSVYLIETKNHPLSLLKIHGARGRYWRGFTGKSGRDGTATSF